MTHVYPTPMTYNQIEEDLAQMHRCTGANIIEKGGKVSGQGGHMFCRQPVAKGYFVEAIIFEG